MGCLQSCLSGLPRVTFPAIDNSGINGGPNQPAVCTVYQKGIKRVSVGIEKCSVQRASEDRWFCSEIIMAKNGVFEATQGTENSGRNAENVITEGTRVGWSAGGSKAVPRMRPQCRCGATAA